MQPLGGKPLAWEGEAAFSPARIPAREDGWRRGDAACFHHFSSPRHDAFLALLLRPYWSPRCPRVFVRNLSPSPAMHSRFEHPLRGLAGLPNVKHVWTD